MEYTLSLSVCVIFLLSYSLHVTALNSPPTSRRALLRDQLLPMVGMVGVATCAPSQPAIAADPSMLPFTGRTTMIAKRTTTIADEASPVPNGVIWRTISGQVLPATPSSLTKIMQNDILGPMSSAVSSGIICISERHDDFEHHKVQLKVLMTMRKVLAERSQSQDASKDLSIGMEMFQRQHQRYLDEFIAKSDYGIGDLKKDTDWDVTWGYDILHYLPLLFFAKKFGIRIVGLHPSDDMIEQVQRHGLRNIVESSVIDEVCTDDREHAEDFKRRAMQRLSLSNFGCQEEMDAAIHRQYEVQCFREDYMAESAAMHMARQPDGWIALLAGEQHILRRNGIPLRALRRSSRKSSPASPSRGVFTIIPKTISFPVATRNAPGVESADYVWYVQRDPSSRFRENEVNNAPLEIEALYLRPNGNGIPSTLAKG